MKNSAYQHIRPERTTFRDSLSFQVMYEEFTRLLKHVLSPYKPEPKEPLVKLDFGSPVGLFEEGHLAICQEIYNNVESRRNTIEQKGSMLLTLVSFVMPLVITVATIAISKIDEIWLRYFVLLISLISIIFIVLSLIAAIRTNKIRQMQCLFIDSLIDRTSKQVKPYDLDGHSRGLLWCASYNNAMYDHITDFVKAGQMFAVLSVVLISFASAVAIYETMDSKNVQLVRGAVSVEGFNANSLNGINRAIDGINAKIDKTTIDVEGKLNKIYKVLQRR